MKRLTAAWFAFSLFGIAAYARWVSPEGLPFRESHSRAPEWRSAELVRPAWNGPGETVPGASQVCRRET